MILVEIRSISPLTVSFRYYTETVMWGSVISDLENPWSEKPSWRSHFSSLSPPRSRKNLFTQIIKLQRLTSQLRTAWVWKGAAAVAAAAVGCKIRREGSCRLVFCSGIRLNQPVEKAVVSFENKRLGKIRNDLCLWYYVWMTNNGFNLLGATATLSSRKPEVAVIQLCECDSFRCFISAFVFFLFCFLTLTMWRAPGWKSGWKMENRS